MSAASRTGYPPYVGEGRVVHAARITAMSTDQETGFTLIEFGDIDSQILARPEWVLEHQPQVGGYMVASDHPSGWRSKGEFMHAQQFEKKYAPDFATAARLQGESNSRTALLIEKIRTQLADEQIKAASVAGEKI